MGHWRRPTADHSESIWPLILTKYAASMTMLTWYQLGHANSTYHAHNQQAQDMLMILECMWASENFQSMMIETRFGIFKPPQAYSSSKVKLPLIINITTMPLWQVSFMMLLTACTQHVRFLKPDYDSMIISLNPTNHGFMGSWVKQYKLVYTF